MRYERAHKNALVLGPLVVEPPLERLPALAGPDLLPLSDCVAGGRPGTRWCAAPLPRILVVLG